MADTATLPAEGEAAPGFELEDQHGETVSLDGLRGSWVVLYFYPRADTPGCTTQACGVRDRSAEYEQAGARVLGVSPDETKAIAKFDDKYGLGFTLLSDEDHAVAEKYGVWTEKKNYGKMYMGVQRSAFLIDENGKVEKAWPKISPKDTPKKLLKALQDLEAS